MILTARKAFRGLLCVVVLMFCVFALIGEVTSNEGLWTLGGSVGMARGTIACFVLLALERLIDIWNGNGWAFRPVKPNE